MVKFLDATRKGTKKMHFFYLKAAWMDIWYSSEQRIMSAQQKYSKQEKKTRIDYDYYISW